MRSIASALLVAISLFLGSTFSAPFVHAAKKPHYGGVLRVELRASNVSLDPRTWKPGSLSFGADEKLASLLFDRLVELDNYGHFQPMLATEWSHDAALKRWQFVLRSNVKFSDGSLLSVGDVVSSLQPLLPDSQQISSSGSNVIIQSSSPIPDLLEELSSGRYFIYRVQPGNSLIGTGPFVVAESVVNSSSANASSSSSDSVAKSNRLRFIANEDCWAGRPFLNQIDVTLGLPPLRQLLDLQLGRADLIELSPELVRRATQENLRVWSSSPTTLYFLKFDDSQPVSSDAKLRQVFSLSLDRSTMAGVLLQKQAEPASALLPQWLSGYAFLFTMETNLERAKELRAALPLNLTASGDPLRLRVETSGDLAKLLGDRVAINVRQAGVMLQVSGRVQRRTAENFSATNSSDSPVGLHLIGWRYSSLSPRLELEMLSSALARVDASPSSLSGSDLDSSYSAEHKLLEEQRILPLIALPEFVGISSNVRDWMPSRWGAWHLADVWLDTPENASEKSINNPVSQQQSVVPGAKP